MNTKTFSLNLLLLLFPFFIACTGGKGLASGSLEKGDAALEDTLTVTYAKGFTLQRIENGYLSVITDPEREEGAEYKFALMREGADCSQVPADYTIIRTPIKRTICMTALQLSSFIKLERLDCVAGITSLRHVFDADFKQRMKDGSIAKIGKEGNFDPEVVISLAPDVILISPFKRGGYDTLTDVQIPLIPHMGSRELTPLGLAEWIKFAGLLIGEEQRADSIFNDIAQRYNQLSKLAAEVEHRPTVFSGELHNGNWYAVGGQSFLAQIFRDAGADYILRDNTDTGGVILEYEKMYAIAADADYWRILNVYEGTYNYDSVRETDERYADFKAWREHGIIYCNMNERGYYESMPVQPDCLLQDFVKVFHPELLPDYTPTYYELLK